MYSKRVLPLKEVEEAVELEEEFLEGEVVVVEPVLVYNTDCQLPILWC